MVKDAEANADDDKKRRELVEAKNQGESLVHSTEKSLKDYGDKVSAADKSVRSRRRRSKASRRRSRRGCRGHPGEDQRADAGVDEARRGDVCRPARLKALPPRAPAARAKQDDVVDADFEEVSDDKGDKKSALITARHRPDEDGSGLDPAHSFAIGRRT
jgi:molecular chaperone DnaK